MNGGKASARMCLWAIRINSVTERFFSGVPHAHLLGVCHRALFFHGNEDALTKVVLNAPALDERLLARHNAEALVVTA